MYQTKIKRIGINDKFGQSGTADELMKYYKLDSESLAERIKSFYKENK